MIDINHSQTKIIATIGPACSSKEVLRKMIHEGIDVCRLNFSHGKQKDHAEVIKLVRQLNNELNTNVALLADLQGPKLRVGEVENNGVELIEGNELVFTTKECKGNAEQVYMSYENLPIDVEVDDIILVDDGKLKLQVVKTNLKDEVVTKIISGGILSSRKGVNLPNTKISLPSLTEKDISDVNFILDFDVDWIALSFVRKVTDILDLKDVIRKKKKNTRIVAKIEKPEALNDIDQIIEATDAIMIARGDLGVEIPFDQVPMIQKQLVDKSISQCKPVIIATQMMESMITNFRPTRAEANDVANAVVDSADTLMLSGETSVGKYPVDVIKSMQRVITATEGKGFQKKYDYKPDPDGLAYLPASICYNACKMADTTNASAIVVFTFTGSSAFRIASHRPNSRIFVFTPAKHLLTQLSILYGVSAFFLEPESSINDAIHHAIEILKSHGFVKENDVLVFVGSIPMRERGNTNVMKISLVS
ncbi:MAG: pyruvate kinase [Bacteroidetes bacterium]|jgi:pyruvate kinase|nr:pyruvate kinase [Bacteroidota bacterium]